MDLLYGADGGGALRVLHEALGSCALSCVLAVVLCACISSYYWLTRGLQGGSSLPGPTRWPLLGNLPMALGSWRRNPLHLANYLADTYGEVAAFWLVRTPVVYLSSHDAVRKAFIDNEDAVNNRPYLHTIQRLVGPIPKGLLWNNGTSHTEMRKFALLAMRDFGVGKQTVEMKIQEEADVMTRTLQLQNGAPVDDMRRLMMMGISNIVISMCFGRRMDYDDKLFVHLMKNVETVFRNSNRSPWTIAFKYLMPFDNSHHNMHQAIGALKSYVTQQIAEHRKDFDAEDPRDFIDLYLQSEYEANEHRDVDNVFQIIIDLFLAGSETTSSTLTWAVLFMLKNPDVQKRLHDEIDAVIGMERQPALADRANLVYVEATLNEVWRMGNIAPLGLPRKASKSFVINGHVIPEGAIIRPNIYRVHMDKEYWQDPEIFRPERWITSEGKLVKHKNFFPFSIGKRNCLGEHLSKHESFLVFTTLLQKFSFVLPIGATEPTLDAFVGVTRLPLPYKMRALRRS